jgi:hypothetical protein
METKARYIAMAFETQFLPGIAASHTESVRSPASSPMFCSPDIRNL